MNIYTDILMHMYDIIVRICQKMVGCILVYMSLFVLFSLCSYICYEIDIFLEICSGYWVFMISFGIFLS